MNIFERNVELGVEAVVRCGGGGGTSHSVQRRER